MNVSGVANTIRLSGAISISSENEHSHFFSESLAFKDFAISTTVSRPMLCRVVSKPGPGLPNPNTT
jgi:hypothetical protein